MAIEQSATVQRLGHAASIGLFALIVPVGLGIAGLFLIFVDLRIAFLVAALILGWSQIGGLCGAAHLSTMRMLYFCQPAVWARSVTAYGLCGLVSATAVGGLLAAAGSVAAPLLTANISLSVVSVVGIFLSLRELGLLPFAIPEKRCQTNRDWAGQFGWVGASAMWGFHIGLGFATVITYGGYWLLVTFIVVQGDIRFGALLMGGYWVGRTLPLFFGHHLPLREQLDPRALYVQFRPINAATLVAATLLGVAVLNR